MSITRSFNRQNGTTYFYEVTGYKYDSKKKRTVPIRHLIGKEDPVTGKMVPTGKRGRPRKNPPAQLPVEKSTETAPSEPVSSDLSDLSDLQSKYEAAMITIARKQARISQLESALHSALSVFQSAASSLSALDLAIAQIEEALKED